MIIESAVYRDGIREDADASGENLRTVLEGLSGSHFLWVGINNPTSAEMTRIGHSLGLHPLAIEDALEAHQRPKIERYRDHAFISLRTVTYSDDDITTNEVNMCVGQHYLLTVRHGGPSIHEARRRLEREPENMRHGPIAAVHAVLDTVVDRYELAAQELEVDVQEVETSVFSREYTRDSPRIYRLKRETLEFRRAVAPLRDPVNRFAMTWAPEASRPYFRDVVDHLQRAFAIDHLLDNALNAYLAQLSVQQNEDMRKLAAGAALIAVPTAVAGIYGMNFEHMPELGWKLGYPVVLIVMALACGYIYHRFKKSGWL